MRTLPLLAFLLLTTPAVAERIVGRATVIDGDTLEIRGSRIRLHGINAREGAQICQNAAGEDYPCGRGAALALSNRIGSTPISHS